MPSTPRPKSKEVAGSGGGLRAPGPSTPMSERQQLALLLQMTSSQSQTPTLNSASHKRSRDRNDRGEHPLHIAAIKGDDDQVKKLLSKGADPNIVDFAGWTPLHEACLQGRYSTSIILVRAGANVNALGLEDDTPLHDAATNGSLGLVKYLLNSGADPFLKNKKGELPVDVAKPPALDYLISLKEPSGTGQRAPTIKFREEQKKTQETLGEKSDKPEMDNNAATSSSSKGSEADTTTSLADEQPTNPMKRPIAPESTDTESKDDDPSKRKKRKDSEGPQEPVKPATQVRGNISRGTLIAGSKPPGPASKTGAAPLSKTGASVGSTSLNKSTAGSTSLNKNTVGSSTLNKSTANVVTNKSTTATVTAAKGNQGATSTNKTAQGTTAANKTAGPGPSGKSIIGTTLPTKSSLSASPVSSTKSITAHQKLPPPSTHTPSKTTLSSQGKVSSQPLATSVPKNNPANIRIQSGGLLTQSTLKGISEKKSPCPSPKPATVSQSKDEPEEGGDTSGPKVPPLKIVIPGGVGSSGTSGSQQEDGSNSARGAAKNRTATNTLPYVINAADTSGISEEDKEDKRGEDKAGQRVLRSHKNTDGGRASPHLGSSSPTNKTPPPSQSSDVSDVTCSVVGNVSTPAPVPSTSTELHPRKRKMKTNKDVHSHSHSHAHPSTSSGSSSTDNAQPSSSTQDTSNLPNPYKMYIDIRKQVERRQKGLFPVQPKPPQGFENYLMNRCSYVLESNVQPQPTINPPVSLSPHMREHFVEQEKNRHELRVQHLVEKQKLVLAVEQEILRAHGRAARALANQTLPFSVCTFLKDKEVYDIQTPEQEEKERNAQRSRYTGRLFLSWLQDVDDKWEKIKEDMVRRHHMEADALHASQTMDWEWKLQELGLHQTNNIQPTHVPKVHVLDDFDLIL